MKIKTITLLIAFTVIIASISTTPAQGSARSNVNFNELNSYGEWVIVSEYGTVWRPDADPSWRPFTFGRWAYSNEGWTWDADEPFGWIVFHYGNWIYDNEQDWVWLPGNQWSPARVSWYVTDNEIGWTPLHPRSRKGNRQNAIQAEWIFSPVSLFTSIDVQRHITIRKNPAPGRAFVHVRAGPPQRSFVQKNVNTPVVRIRLNKAHVRTQAKPLIRVDIQGQRRPEVQLPIGPRYKRVKIHSEQNNHMNSTDEKNHDSPNDKNKVKVQVHTR
jgi:hypothetical protein